MTITKKDYIIKQYLDFQNEIKKILPINIFPSLEDVDITDIILYFQMTFLYCDNYDPIVRELLSSYHIQYTPEQYNIIYPIIARFIDKFKLFITTN